MTTALSETSTRKLPPDDKLRKLFAAHPCLTFTAVAHKYGVSRERVRQKVRKLKIPHRFHNIKVYKTCPRCGVISHRNNLFCSPKCHFEYHHVPIVCDGCGKVFYRTQTQTLYPQGKEHPKNEHFYCSHPCMRSAWQTQDNHAKEFLCPICGTLRRKNHGLLKTDTPTCSRSCAMKLRWRKKREASR